MTDLKPSPLSVIADDFKDIIKWVKETDQNGQASTAYIQRKTFVFIDDSYMSITEFIDTKKNLITKYFYDWYDKDKNEIMKFHSESHTEQKDQTETEPYHIHGRKSLNPFKKRFPNYYFQNLYHILEFVRLMLIYNGTIQ